MALILCKAISWKDAEGSNYYRKTWGSGSQAGRACRFGMPGIPLRLRLRRTWKAEVKKHFESRIANCEFKTIATLWERLLAAIFPL